MLLSAGQCAGVEVQQPTERPLSAAPVAPVLPATPSELLSWLPATCSAVSLRLFAIDSAIIYRPGHQPGRESLQVTATVQALALCCQIFASRCSCTSVLAAYLCNLAEEANLIIIIGNFVPPSTLVCHCGRLILHDPVPDESEWPS